MEIFASPKTASMTVLQYSITQVITMEVISSTAVTGRKIAMNLRLLIFFFASVIFSYSFSGLSVSLRRGPGARGHSLSLESLYHNPQKNKTSVSVFVIFATHFAKKEPGRTRQPGKGNRFRQGPGDRAAPHPDRTGGPWCAPTSRRRIFRRSSGCCAARSRDSSCFPWWCGAAPRRR